MQYLFIRFTSLTPSRQLQSLSGIGVRWPFPLSVIYVRSVFELGNVIPLFAVVSVVAVVERWRLSRFAKRLFVGFIILELAGMVLHFSYDKVPDRIMRFGDFSAFLLGSVPLFFGLLAAIWNAKQQPTCSSTDSFGDFSPVQQ